VAGGAACLHVEQQEVLYFDDVSGRDNGLEAALRLAPDNQELRDVFARVKDKR